MTAALFIANYSFNFRSTDSCKLILPLIVPLIISLTPDLKGLIMPTIPWNIPNYFLAYPQ